MASRVGVAVLLLAVAVITVGSASAQQPPTGTAMYVVRQDMRLCPSPLCGGYWVALANAARTRCQDGLRRPRCYVARALDTKGGAITGIEEGALVRGAIDLGRDDLGELRVAAVYDPAGKAAPTGGWYRLADNGIRCVRAPCFSTTVAQVNGKTRTPVSSVDLAASGATAAEVARASRAVATKDGLYARGRFGRTADGGTVFRTLRLYLRAPLPPA